MSKKKKIPLAVKKIREHKFPLFDYSHQKIISYSQWSIFLNCPHKWALQYVKKLAKPEQNIQFLFGKAIHNTIQQYITQVYETSGAEADRSDVKGYFENELSEIYKADYKKNNNTHFTNPSELREFFDDGIDILDFLQKKKAGYFNKKGWHLIGCEIPIQLTPHPLYKNVIFKGSLDMVLYHEPTNKYKIIDFKTSTKGWNDMAKRDEIKQYQLILYKQFFSQIYNIPLEDIDIEFFILKRKLYENCDFPQKRIQIFVPPSGKIKLNRATQLLDNFIISSFNTDSSYKNEDFEPNATLDNCKWCVHKDSKNLCPKGIS